MKKSPPMLWLIALLCVACAGPQVQTLSECESDHRQLRVEHEDLQRLYDNARREATSEETPVEGVLTDEDLEAVLTELDVPYRSLRENTYGIDLRGARVLIYNRGHSMQLYASFELQPPLDTINHWNMSRRFSRAYLDESGDATLEADLYMGSGWSPQMIEEFVYIFEASLNAYAEYLYGRT